jgi:hypothetical protein
VGLRLAAQGIVPAWLAGVCNTPAATGRSDAKLVQ